MDEYSGKRAVNGHVMPRRGLRNTADNRDENFQFCSRLGCSGRPNSSKSSGVGSTDKPRPFRPTFNSSNGKEVIGSSSRTSSVMTNLRKSSKESHRKSASHVEKDLSEPSSSHGKPKVSEQVHSSTEHQPRFNSATRDTGSSKVLLPEVGCSSGTSSSRPRKIFCQKSALYNQNSPLPSYASSPSRAIGSGTKGSISGASYGLKNLKCNSVSDVVSQNGSPSESRFSRRDMVKRRNLEGESSSAIKGKKMTGASPKEGQVTRPTRGISISDSRSNRNLDYREDNRAVSSQTRRSMNMNSRLRGPVKNSSHTESSGSVQSLPRPETPNLNLQSSSQFFTDGSSSDSSSYSFPGNDVEDLPSVVPFTSAELGINRLMNRETLQRYNIDGVAQVLLALERIEQDEELTYERLLASNLFLNGLNLFDQHRDMRMDIDNMSYEELLALEERMGNVSTALSEEALTKCLQKSIYQGIPSDMGAFGEDDDEDEDEIKCSICQQEYVIGDELGKLDCEHGYHVECLEQWLRLKNWCPICKASAAPSSTTLS